MTARHTVLVVAPEGNVRREILRNLRSKGCLVSVAGRADTALEMLSGFRFDLMLRVSRLARGGQRQGEPSGEAS